MTRVYAGSTDEGETFASDTLIDVGLLEAGQKASISRQYLAYLTRGSGLVNGTPVIDGDLIRGEDLSLVATEDAQLIVVHSTQ